MSETNLRLVPEELRTIAGALNQLSTNTDTAQQSLLRSWARLDAGWDTYAEANLNGYYNEALKEIGRMAAMLSQMSAALSTTADSISQADQAVVAAFNDLLANSSGSQAGSGKPPGLARMMPQPPPPWESDGFAWWAEAFRAEHGRSPTEDDYREFQLSWELSGQGQVQWTEGDWEAFYYARLAGLEKWMAAGLITGPLTGTEALAAVEALNAQQSPDEQPEESPPPDPPPPTGTPMIVAAEGALNLRTGPGTGNDVIRGIPEGATVMVDPNVEPVSADGYTWVPVTYTDPSIADSATAASPDFQAPLAAFTVGSLIFGSAIDYNSGLTGDWSDNHPGIDYFSSQENAPITASASGTVVASGNQSGGYGNYVIVEYPAASVPDSIQGLSGYEDGDSAYIIYAHLADTEDGLPAVDTQVQTGDTIGLMGDTGNTGGADHLHMEVRFGEADLQVNTDSAVDSDGANNWYDPDTLVPADPGLMFSPTDTWSGWVAIESEDGDTYLVDPPETTP